MAAITLVPTIFQRKFRRMQNGAEWSFNNHEERLAPADVADVALALAGSASVKIMVLKGHYIGNEGAVVLAVGLMANHSLHTLDLSGNFIGPPGAAAIAEALCHNTSLEVLHLYNNKVDDLGAGVLGEALLANHGLTHLNLARNGIGERGAAALAEGLLVNNSLKNLNLRNNTMGDGFGFGKFADSLRTNKGLRSLILADNAIGTWAMQRLAHGLHDNKTLQRVDLAGSHPMEAGMKALEDELGGNTALIWLPGLTGMSCDLDSMMLNNRKALVRPKTHRKKAAAVAAIPAAVAAVPMAVAAVPVAALANHQQGAAGTTSSAVAPATSQGAQSTLLVVPTASALLSPAPLHVVAQFGPVIPSPVAAAAAMSVWMAAVGPSWRNPQAVIPSRTPASAAVAAAGMFASRLAVPHPAATASSSSSPAELPAAPPASPKEPRDPAVPREAEAKTSEAAAALPPPVTRAPPGPKPPSAKRTFEELEELDAESQEAEEAAEETRVAEENASHRLTFFLPFLKTSKAMEAAAARRVAKEAIAVAEALEEANMDAAAAQREAEERAAKALLPPISTKRAAKRSREEEKQGLEPPKAQAVEAPEVQQLKK